MRRWKKGRVKGRRMALSNDINDHGKRCWERYDYWKVAMHGRRYRAMFKLAYGIVLARSFDEY